MDLPLINHNVSYFQWSSKKTGAGIFSVVNFDYDTPPAPYQAYTKIWIIVGGNFHSLLNWTQIWDGIIEAGISSSVLGKCGIYMST